MIAVLFAAGQSRRFGDADKRLTRMPEGATLLAAMIRRLNRADLHCLLAVDGEFSPPPELAAETLICVNAENGMGSSIADVASHLLASSDAEALLLLPVDLPLIRVSTLAVLAGAADAERIIAPRCDQRRGHPVVFGRRFWKALSRLAGDTGGREVLAANRDALQLVDVDDPGIYLDADTSETMTDLLSRLQPRAR